MADVKGSLAEARKKLDKAFGKYQVRFKEIRTHERAVRVAIEKYEEARAKLFIEKIREHGINFCTLSISKECERIAPQSTLDYAYLKLAEEKEGKKIREAVKESELSKEDKFVPGVYAVCSTCMRELLLTGHIHLGGSYFSVQHAQSDGKVFMADTGEPLTGITVIERPPDTSSFLSDEAKKEIGLPASAHFNSALEMTFYKEKLPEPKLQFVSMLEMLDSE